MIESHSAKTSLRDLPRQTAVWLAVLVAGLVTSNLITSLGNAVWGSLRETLGTLLATTAVSGAILLGAVGAAGLLGPLRGAGRSARIRFVYVINSPRTSFAMLCRGSKSAPGARIGPGRQIARSSLTTLDATAVISVTTASIGMTGDGQATIASRTSKTPEK